jgi:hypothetical protein
LRDCERLRGGRDGKARARGLRLSNPNSPKQAVAFIYQTSRKIKRIFRTCLARRIEHKLPERAIDESAAVRILQRAQEIAGCRIERVDRSVAEIADEEII